MSSFRKLATRANSESGQVLQLNGPDGKPCGEWIKVRGVDSDTFAAANRQMRRNMISALEEHTPEHRKTTEFAKTTELEQKRLQAALVIEWSFDEECTVDNIVELFTEAPYIADQVDIFAGKRERFVAGSPTNSSPSPSNKSDSASPSNSTASPGPRKGSTSSKLPVAAEAGSQNV